MTGRELIIYILDNYLESNDLEYILSEEILVSEEEAASKFKVGVETIRAWYSLGILPGIKIKDSLYFFRDVRDPRTK